MRLDVGRKHRDRAWDLHTLRRGDHVYQRVNPWHSGTVTRAEGDHGFVVAYDTGGHYWFPASRTIDFLIGTPTTEQLAQSQPPQGVDE